MNRVLCIIFLSVVFVSAGKGQLRHSRGSQTIGAALGISPQTSVYGIRYGYHLNDRMNILASTYMQKVRFDFTDYASYTIQPEFLHSILSNNRNAYLNVKAGLIVGLEVLYSASLNKKITHTFYGESVGIGGEVYIHSHVNLTLEVEQQFWQGSKIAACKPFVKLGISYTI